jgi:hypothetical protein
MITSSRLSGSPSPGVLNLKTVIYFYSKKCKWFTSNGNKKSMDQKLAESFKLNSTVTNFNLTLTVTVTRNFTLRPLRSLSLNCQLLI